MFLELWLASGFILGLICASLVIKSTMRLDRRVRINLVDCVFFFLLVALSTVMPFAGLFGIIDYYDDLADLFQDQDLYLFLPIVALLGLFFL